MWEKSDDGDRDVNEKWSATTRFEEVSKAIVTPKASTGITIKFNSASAFGVGATALAAAFSVLAF